MLLSWVALLLLECLMQLLVALVLCEACVTLATPLEMELAGPQSHLLLLAGVVCLVVVVGDQPMLHPEQLASEDDQC